MITASPGWYLSLSSAAQRPAGQPARCIRQPARRDACADLSRTCRRPAADLACTWRRCWQEIDIEVTCTTAEDFTLLYRLQCRDRPLSHRL
jgi:hypothetical protein